jgi:4a-hydroxytetrahydrobiopterin dehydratase
MAGWQLVNGSLEKQFRFKDFNEAFAFMTRVAPEAEKLGHHPDWANVYNRVTVRLSTHEAGAVTDLDFQLASKMDAAF